MKQKTLLIGILILLVAMNGFFALAAENEMVKAGTTPGNAFYGFDKLGEKIQLMFTAGELKQAKLHVKFAEERLAELEEVVDKGKTKHIQGLTEDYNEELEKAEQKMNKAAEKGEHTAEVAAHVAEMTYKHVAVLERVLEKAPEQAREHIQHAIQMSIKGNQQAVESIEKETGKPADVPKAKQEGETSGEQEQEQEEGETEGQEQEKEKEGKGKLEMQITDKPASINITKMEVTISSVRVHTSGEAAPSSEVCEEEEYEELVCTNETVVIDDDCTNITEEQEVCINETFYNETCTEDECVNGTFVEESTCVNGTMINDTCVNGTLEIETVCVNGTFVPAGCTNESYIEEVCTNETVVINQTCNNETETEEVCENVTMNETVCTDTGDGNAGWKTVVDEEQTFDLIELIGVKEFLGETDLTSGKYTQIRLLVSSINLEVDGVPVTLKVPSNKIKLIKPFTISANKTTTLTLDFDAEKSVHQAGDKYILKPTIKVIQE